MFDTPPPLPPQQNPLNPVMPNPGMEPMGSVPPAPTAAPAPTAPQVHTMPDRFRATGGGSGPKGSGTTKKLMIVLIVVIVVAALGVAGLYVLNNILTKSNTNNANTTNTTNTVDNTNLANDNTNVSTNLNTNATLNVNDANANGNSNANANSNANTNSAVNANSNTNASTNSNANTNTSVSSTTPLPSSVDSDHDGLTDVEEAAYGTDVNNPDTDGDGFVDGKQVKADGSIVGELYQGYNPKGAGTLEASTIVKRVTNSTKTFSILVPAGWTTSSDSSGGLLVTPSVQNGEFFQVRTADNSTQLAPKAWYQQNNPSADVSALKLVTVNGLEGIMSEDGSTVYLFKGTKIYSIQYGTGSLTTADYWTTFDMIQHSFKLGA